MHVVLSTSYTQWREYFIQMKQNCFIFLFFFVWVNKYVSYKIYFYYLFKLILYIVTWWQVTNDIHIFDNVVCFYTFSLYDTQLIAGLYSVCVDIGWCKFYIKLFPMNSNLYRGTSKIKEDSNESKSSTC